MEPALPPHNDAYQVQRDTNQDEEVRQEDEVASPSLLQSCVGNIWLHATYPWRWLCNSLLSYRYVYILSVHDSGYAVFQTHPCGQSSQARKDYRECYQQRPSHHRTFGLFATDSAARVALTDVLGLPEYAGRRVRLGFPEVGKREPGVMVAASGMLGYGSRDGSAGSSNMVDEGIVAVIEKMYVRSSGL